MIDLIYEVFQPLCVCPYFIAFVIILLSLLLLLLLLLLFRVGQSDSEVRLSD